MYYHLSDRRFTKTPDTLGGFVVAGDHLQNDQLRRRTLPASVGGPRLHRTDCKFKW